MEVNREKERNRALNIVWTGAKRYGWQPDFLAFDQDGRAEYYLNLIVGCAKKWFPGEELSSLERSFQGAALEEVYDTVFWLCLESCIYGKELPERPVLQELREEYAGRLADQYRLGGENGLAWTLQCGHFMEALGLQAVAAPWERRLLSEMHFPAGLTGKEAADRIQDILRRYFRFRQTGGDKAYAGQDGMHIRLYGGLGLWFLGRGGRKKGQKRPLMVRFSGGGISSSPADAGTGKTKSEEEYAKTAGGIAGLLARLALFFAAMSGKNEIRQRAYVEESFGKPVYTGEKSRRLEAELCTGNHAGCRLYFASAEGKAVGIDKANETIARKQEASNRAWYREHQDMARTAAMRLKAQIENTILAQQEPENLPAREGRLDQNLAWRYPVLGDSRVFQKVSQEAEHPFSVDLLLDASSSQLHRQEIIAAQGYILAKALGMCGIPTQISSFCTEEHYTVFRLFQTYEEKGKEDNIFRYFASGWNRDGLAIRTAGKLMGRSPCEKRLLLILTDASPNDDGKMPGKRTGRTVDYAGQVAVEDTAAEVRALRKKGIRTAAIFCGLDSDLPAAARIYGSSLARISEMDQLADKAGRLIRGEIRRMYQED